MILFAKISTRHEIFCLVNHLHGLLTLYFYDFNCRFICKVSGAEIYAPLVFKLKIVGNDWVPFFCHYIVIISGYSFLRYDKKKQKEKHGQLRQLHPVPA
jgi:hypothetical protein